ncbi:MAG: transposase [Candidatus Caldatribacteriaceae bacterium]
MYSKNEPLKKFARMLKRHLPCILAHCRYPIHMGGLKGINNKIKVINRVAYGYRDEERFFLKIRGAFRPATPLEGEDLFKRLPYSWQCV